MPFMFPLTDAHVHPDFSIDAKGTVTEYCDRALEIGLSEIIFATHVDTDPLFPDENVMVIDGERSEPLAQVFGYVTRLRSLSQGRATAAMSPSHYAPVSPEEMKTLVG